MQAKHQDLDALDRCLQAGLAYGDLEAEDASQLTLTNVLRVARLCQLAIQYFIATQNGLVSDLDALQVRTAACCKAPPLWRQAEAAGLPDMLARHMPYQLGAGQCKCAYAHLTAKRSLAKLSPLAMRPPLAWADMDMLLCGWQAEKDDAQAQMAKTSDRLYLLKQKHIAAAKQIAQLQQVSHHRIPVFLLLVVCARGATTCAQWRAFMRCRAAASTSPSP